MKILYVGHPAHDWSGSSKFFKDILEGLGTVKYLAPTPVSVKDDLLFALEENFDLYVFFQFDFMAYAFIHSGKNVLIAPMVDGSGGYGLAHWNLLRTAKFLTFSKTLDNFLRLQNFRTLYVKFWPQQEKYISPLNDSVYFWPRINQFPITVKHIDHLFQGSKKIYVRLSTNDPIEIDSLGPIPDTVVLTKIENRNQHIAELQKSSIFIAPRMSEGIGHSFLEALSVGRPVVGYNFPVMSEYIKNNSTGMLITKKTKPFDLSVDWNQMGENAYKSVADGRENYLSSKSKVEKFILTSTRKRKVKSIRKVLDLVNLSVEIYNKRVDIDGLFNLGHFAMTKDKLNLKSR
jgi:hypothetical protein